MLSQQKRGAGRQEVDLDETSFAGPNEAPVPKNRIENGQKRSLCSAFLLPVFFERTPFHLLSLTNKMRPFPFFTLLMMTLVYIGNDKR